MISNNRRKTAFHEAGHIMCANVFDYRVSWARIAQDGATGETECCLPFDDSAHSFNIAVVLMGGPAAELVLSGDPVSTKRAADDLEAAREVLAGNNIMLHAACARAVALVRRHWELVRTVARELERRGRLDAVTIEWLFLRG